MKQDKKTNQKKYRQSETIVINRSQIMFAPYNPKNHRKEHIDEIKKNIKRVAFLGGIVWNETTSNLIDGHKRIAALDIINNYNGNENDYTVKVEKIALDEKTEREQNIFQTKSRTELDNELLADLIKGGINIEFAGLTEEDIDIIQVEVPDFDYTEFNGASDDFKKFEKPKAERGSEQWQKTKEIHDAIKHKKADGSRYFTITFVDYQSKESFLESLGFNGDEDYISGEIFEQKINDIIGE